MLRQVKGEHGHNHHHHNERVSPYDDPFLACFCCPCYLVPPCSEGLGGACLRLVTQSCIALDGIEIKDPSITTTTGIPIDPHFGHQQGSTVDTFSFL
ncbi:hypothetical protein C3L33_03897, partial [Rhododendron williamsianum]